jgi:hypothetical protein
VAIAAAVNFIEAKEDVCKHAERRGGAWPVELIPLR